MSRACFLVLPLLLLFAARPVSGADYTLKVELIEFTQKKIGNKKSYRSDVRTLEVLTSAERRFQCQTTWGRERLSATGKLSAADDDLIELEIDCGHFVKTGVIAAETLGGPVREIENATRATTTIKLHAGEQISLGGMKSKGTTETPTGPCEQQQQTFLQVTIIESELTE